MFVSLSGTLEAPPPVWRKAVMEISRSWRSYSLGGAHLQDIPFADAELGQCGPGSWPVGGLGSGPQVAQVCLSWGPLDWQSYMLFMYFFFLE